MTNSPIKQRQLHFNYFVNKQNEPLELLSLHFRCLAGSANKDGVSKDFMSDKKIEKEIFKYSVCRTEQTYASEMKRKRHNLGTESYLTAGDENGNWKRNVVFSIRFTESSCRRKLFHRYKIKKKLIPLRRFYPNLYSAPNFNSSYNRKITK